MLLEQKQHSIFSDHEAEDCAQSDIEPGLPFIPFFVRHFLEEHLDRDGDLVHCRDDNQPRTDREDIGEAFTDAPSAIECLPVVNVHDLSVYCPHN